MISMNGSRNTVNRCTDDVNGSRELSNEPWPRLEPSKRLAELGGSRFPAARGQIGPYRPNSSGQCFIAVVRGSDAAWPRPQMLASVIPQETSSTSSSTSGSRPASR